MLRKIDCFSVVDEVIQEATKQFAPLFKIRQFDYDVLKSYCEIIDTISDNAEGIAYDVEVNDITLDITISFICEDLTIENSQYIFYDLAEKAKELKFSTSDFEDDSYLSVGFVFPSIWEKI